MESTLVIVTRLTSNLHWVEFLQPDLNVKGTLGFIAHLNTLALTAITDEVKYNALHRSQERVAKKHFHFD